tara:strand:- start:35 stop:304 length:270 start_codon:yes stop_codon:yes gene_type:complete
MTEIEWMYYNNREALIDEICDLEDQVGNLVQLGELHEDADPSEFFPRFGELAENLTWINPHLVGREHINLTVTPMSKEAFDLQEEHNAN